MSKIVRTKQITLDGAEFTIAPLTLEQIEQYVNIEDLANHKEVGFKKAYDVVCYGLNNALPKDAPETEKWTPARVKTEIDLMLFELLQTEIIKFSGFGVKEDKVRVPGESSAAPDAGSSHPAITAEASQAATSATSDVAS